MANQLSAASSFAPVVSWRDKAGMTVSDNGTEFAANAILTWCKDHEIEWAEDYDTSRHNSSIGYQTQPATRKRPLQWVQACLNSLQTKVPRQVNPYAKLICLRV